MKEKCPFYFNVYYSNLHKRWFIPRNGNGLSCHCGHIRLAPDEVRISTNNLDETVLQRVIGQLEHQIDNSAIRALLHSETGTTFTDQQIRNLRASMVIDGTGDTPAERLFTFLEESPHIRFVAMTASNDRQSLITIRTSKKDRSRIDEYNYPEDPSEDQEDNPNTFARRAMKALTLEDGQKLLLGVAWITEEGMYNKTLKVKIHIVTTHLSHLPFALYQFHRVKIL